MKSTHKENSREWWDEKFSAASPLLYGKEPSPLVMDALSLLPAGATVLEVATGEGRQAVALAKKGFKVTSLDFSSVALERAKQYALESGVEITFKSQDLDLFLPDLMAWDAIISVDFKPATTLLKNLARGLKQNGILLMEAFLIEACKTDSTLEVFETFKPAELLMQFATPTGSFRVLKYSELELAENQLLPKVFMAARKTQLL